MEENEDKEKNYVDEYDNIPTDQETFIKPYKILEKSIDTPIFEERWILMP